MNISDLLTVAHALILILLVGFFVTLYPLWFVIAAILATLFILIVAG